MFLEGIPMTSWHHQESDFPQSIMPSSSISYPASWCPQKRWLTIAIAKSPRLDLFRQVPRPHSKPLPPSSVKSLPSPETIPAASQPRGELHGVTHCNSWRQPMYRRLHQIQVLCATRPSKAPLNKNRGWISSQQFSPHEKTRGLFLLVVLLRSIIAHRRSWFHLSEFDHEEWRCCVCCFRTRSPLLFQLWPPSPRICESFRTLWPNTVDSSDKLHRWMPFRVWTPWFPELCDVQKFMRAWPPIISSNLRYLMDVENLLRQVLIKSVAHIFGSPHSPNIRYVRALVNTRVPGYASTRGLAMFHWMGTPRVLTSSRLSISQEL